MQPLCGGLSRTKSFPSFLQYWKYLKQMTGHLIGTFQNLLWRAPVSGTYQGVTVQNRLWSPPQNIFCMCTSVEFGGWCVGLSTCPQRYPVLIVGVCESYLTWQKGFADVIKDLEGGTLSVNFMTSLALESPDSTLFPGVCESVSRWIPGISIWIHGLRRWGCPSPVSGHLPIHWGPKEKKSLGKEEFALYFFLSHCWAGTSNVIFCS